MRPFAPRGTVEFWTPFHAGGGCDNERGCHGLVGVARLKDGVTVDAANAIINGLKVSLKDATDAESARENTITEVGKVSFDGATGKVAFDEFGDTTNKVITAYEVKDGKWVAVKTGT